MAAWFLLKGTEKLLLIILELKFEYRDIEAKACIRRDEVKKTFI